MLSKYGTNILSLVFPVCAVCPETKLQETARHLSLTPPLSCQSLSNSVCIITSLMHIKRYRDGLVLSVNHGFGVKKKKKKRVTLILH